MKFHYIAKISYDGSRYQGWQIQKGHPKTIQGIIGFVLKELCKGSEEIKTIGSSRTDTGVHALCQIAKISIPINIEPSGLQKGLNALLPKDIRVLNITATTSEFHPIRDAYQKEYIYLFSNNHYFGKESPFQLKRIVNYPFKIDLELMREVCSLYVGKHDFKNFRCLGSSIKTTKREIYSCTLNHEKPHGSLNQILPEYYVFKICGSGFLKQMVRLLVGAMWNVGRGKITIDDVKLSLQGDLREKLSPVAPPEGLYLSRIDLKTN